MKKAFGIMLAMTVLVWTGGMATAGALDPSGSPDPSRPAMPTLQDMYDKLVERCGDCLATEGGGAGPTDPPASTMYTLHQLYDIMHQCCDPSCPPASGALVPKSGQKTIYNSNDDGHLQRGVALPDPRFTKNGNGTVTDNLTGLIWTENANIGDGTKTFTNAIATCEACTVGGYTDWHLPNVKELNSLINYEFFNPAIPNTTGSSKWTSGNPFTGVNSLYYWTSTTNAAVTSEAMRVHLWYAITNHADKGTQHYAWCVRGGVN